MSWPTRQRSCFIEFSRVFAFQRLLHRISEVFRNEPELLDSLEQRLKEILFDEMGHVTS